MKEQCENNASTTSEESVKLAMRVSWVSVVANIILAVLKLLAGFMAKSSAMISDAVHSASDVFSTFVVMIGVSISAKQEDDDHPYGHERMECVASVVLAVLLAITGLGIGVAGFRKIIAGNYEELAVPGMLALVATVASIIVKEAMYWYTRGAAKKINSGALLADAWHHRSDALSSIGAFIGILGARMGFPVLDPVASIVICIFIEKAALDIFMDATDKMVDKSCPVEMVEQMQATILACENVLAVDDLKTRLFGSKVYAEVEIAVEGSMPLVDAHEIAEHVHDAIEENYPDVKHCMVHVNPK